MAATNYTPISLYYSTTAAAVPVNTNLVNGELAINITDGKLFYKDNSGTVQVLATKGAGTIGGSNTQVQYNNSGALAGSANLTFNGTTLTANTLNLTNALGTTYGGTGLTSFTANGVVYASSSSVLATGSALTFDGTNFGTTGNANLGSGSKSTDTQLNFASDLGTQRIYLDRGTRSLVFYDATTAIENYRIAGITGIQTWGVGGTEQMRLTSTGLGIGTSSPTEKLDIVGRMSIATSTSPNAQGQYGYNLLGGTYIWPKAGSLSDFILYRSDGNPGLQMTSSGNLGLGVTPSAWVDDKALQLPQGSVSSGYEYGISVAAGAYRSASNIWRYTQSIQPVSRFNQVNGTYQWFVAPSGTAGNAITFTQAMTLDASGNLGIGTSSPAQKLTVAVADAAQAAQFRGTTGYVRFRPYVDATNGAIIDATNAAESAYSTLTVIGSTLRLFGGSASGATIDASGNLLVGTASNPPISAGQSAQLVAYAASGNIVAASQAASATGFSYISQSVTAAGTGWYHFYGASGNGSTLTTSNIFIYGNGNIQNTNNSYGAISDIKLKENIVDATPKLADLMQVKVRNYNLKGDYEKHKQLGVVAQELEVVFPAMVDETNDTDAEGNDLGTTTKSVKYSVFVPMLIKAMQEQQALIQSLTNRIAKLENKL
jgi:hypothetical protein